MIKKNYNPELIELMRKKGLNVRTLSVAIGLSRPTVMARLENPQNMTLEQIDQLAGALSVSRTAIIKCIDAA